MTKKIKSISKITDHLDKRVRSLIRHDDLIDLAWPKDQAVKQMFLEGRLPQEPRENNRQRWKLWKIRWMPILSRGILVVMKG
jgi:hypothetical protein